MGQPIPAPGQGEGLVFDTLAMPFARQVPSGMASCLTYPAHRAEQRKLQACLLAQFNPVDMDD